MSLNGQTSLLPTGFVWRLARKLVSDQQHFGLATLCAGLAILSISLAGCTTAVPTAGDDATTRSVNATNNSQEDAQAAIANQVPDTDILLFELDASTANLSLRFLHNATSRPGYDNQPAFIPGTQDFLFSSIIDGTQSDVYVYHAASQKISQVTDTALSEYSPTPLADGGFSSVTVETDGTQRLWRYSPLGRAIQPIRGDVTGVGYHAWLAEQQLALFIVADPLTLDIVSTSSDERTQIATNPGRSLHRIPNQKALSFVQMAQESDAQLMRWDQASGEISRLVVMPTDVQDMTWLPDGRAMLVAGTELLIWEPGTNSWQARFELAEFISGPITRIAVNDQADRLALVVNPAEPASE